MKGKNWLLVLLIVVLIFCFAAYRTIDRMKTDTEAPEIVMDGQFLELSVKDPRSAMLQGVRATDETDGDVTASLVVESISLVDTDGTIRVSYAAFDRSGNVSKASREIKYTDYESPRFQLESPLLYSYSSGFDIASTLKAADVLDGDIQHRIRVTSLDESSIGNIGTHQVLVQVSNSLGDTSRLELPVEVYEAGIYKASVELTEYLVYLDVGASFDPDDYLDSYSLRDEVTDLRNSIPENYTVKTVGSVQTGIPGVYVVKYYVTYVQRNEMNPDLDESYKGYTKLIVVVEG